MPNPDPKNFKILRYQHVNGNLVIEVKYPDCTNYEGRKIMVYKNTTVDILKIQGSIDPHFCNNSRMRSPFLRTEPTAEGWQVALKLAESL